MPDTVPATQPTNTRRPADSIPVSPPTLRPADAPAWARPIDGTDHADGKLAYLTRIEAAALAAFTEVIIVPPEGLERAVPPRDVVRSIDRFLAINRSIMRHQIRLATFILTWWPLTRFKPPFWMMSYAARRRFVSVFPSGKGFVMSRLAKLKNLILVNYYSDPRTNLHTRYAPFEQRRPIGRAVRELIAKRDGVEPADPSAFAPACGLQTGEALEGVSKDKVLTDHGIDPQVQSLG